MVRLPTIEGVIWRNPVVFSVFIVVLFLFSWFVTYYTGGTKFTHLHIVYLPIMLCALRFGVLGGIAGGLIAALLLGPFMPLDVAMQEPQSTKNWMFRGVYLVLVGGFVGVLHTLMTRQQRQVDTLSNYDATTDLPLIGRFIAAIERFIDDREDEFSVVSVVVDNANNIQSSFGLDFYEKIIKTYTSFIAEHLPEGAIFGRSGFNRFIIMIPEQSREEAVMFCENLHRQIEIDLHDSLNVFPFDIRFGLSFYPDQGHNADELVRSSQAALNIAKPVKSQIFVYNSDQDNLFRANLELMSHLEAAIRNGDIRFFIQPKIWIDDGSVAGGELLVRWQHPVHGDIPPPRFIELAEQTHHIHSITKACVIAATGYIRNTTAIVGDASIRIAANVSTRDLTDPRFVETVLELCRGHHQLLRNLELEITESAGIENYDDIVETLLALRAAGIHLAIDDFGTGYSSLTYLKHIPAGTLKIDKSFINGILESPTDEMFVRKTIELASELNMRTVAEGVETEAVAERLASMGCQIAQGWLYGKAIPPEDWQPWLTSHSLSESAKWELPRS